MASRKHLRSFVRSLIRSAEIMETGDAKILALRFYHSGLTYDLDVIEEVGSKLHGREVFGTTQTDGYVHYPIPHAGKFRLSLGFSVDLQPHLRVFLPSFGLRFTPDLGNGRLDTGQHLFDVTVPEKGELIWHDDEPKRKKPRKRNSKSKKKPG